MSYDRPLPPPLPPQGFLLEQLGYLKEPLAAIALDIRLPTLIEYRKKKIGPKFAVIGRTIWYGPTHLQEWVEAGGTLAFTGDGAGCRRAHQGRQAEACAQPSQTCAQAHGPQAGGRKERHPRRSRSWMKSGPPLRGGPKV